MDASVWSMLAVASGVGLIGSAIALFRRRSRAQGNTPMVQLVRRRRELTQRLNDLAGPSGAEMARLEARRKGLSSVSIEALEAAIARAERLSLHPGRTAASDVVRPSA